MVVVGERVAEGGIIVSADFSEGKSKTHAFQKSKSRRKGVIKFLEGCAASHGLGVERCGTRRQVSERAIGIGRKEEMKGAVE